MVCAIISIGSRSHQHSELTTTACFKGVTSEDLLEKKNELFPFQKASKKREQHQSFSSPSHLYSNLLYTLVHYPISFNMSFSMLKQARWQIAKRSGVQCFASSENLVKTALYDLHKELGGDMVPFAGYELPVLYKGENGGVMKEHLWCRADGKAAMFDVSHMGQVCCGVDRERNQFPNISSNCLADLLLG